MNNEVLTVDIKPVRRVRDSDPFELPINLNEVEGFDESIERLTFINKENTTEKHQHRYLVKKLIDISDLEIQG